MQSRKCCLIVQSVMFALLCAPAAFGAPLLQMDFGRNIPDSPLQTGFLNTTTGGQGGTRLNAIELNAVPEPSAIVLTVFSAIAAGWVVRRR
jgi:hypothetical protein